MKTVQLSRLWFWVAVLAADLWNVLEKEEKIRWAPRIDVLMVAGDSLVRERAVDSPCTSFVRRIGLRGFRRQTFRKWDFADHVLSAKTLDMTAEIWGRMAWSHKKYNTDQPKSVLRNFWAAKAPSWLNKVIITSKWLPNIAPGNHPAQIIDRRSPSRRPRYLSMSMIFSLYVHKHLSFLYLGKKSLWW